MEPEKRYPTKDFKPIGVKDLKQEDGVGTGTAIFSQFNVRDHDGDVTLAGAFGSQDVKLLNGHSWDGPPIGKGTIREGEKYAYCDFQINCGTQLGTRLVRSAQVRHEQRSPALQEWSYGYFIEESDWGELRRRASPISQEE